MNNQELGAYIALCFVMCIFGTFILYIMCKICKISYLCYKHSLSNERDEILRSLV